MAKGSKKPSIVPLGDRVLVKLLPREAKTASGIIIPETISGDRSDNRRGTVVAVGEGKYDDGKLVPMNVNEGDEVLFQWGEKIEFEHEEYFVVSESNILAIIK
jgi:chaperonin GroES